MDIISPFAERETVQAWLDKLANGDEAYKELYKFIHEVATAHNLLLDEISGLNYPTAHMVLKDTGLQAASLTTQKTYQRRSNSNELIYRYASPCISKEKCSANSDRDARDSSKLSTLMRALKKNNEVPTQEKIQSALASGMHYAFYQVSKEADRTQFSINMDADMSVALTKFAIGVDNDLSSMYIEQLKQKYSEYLVKVDTHRESNKNKARFAKGATVVCIYDPQRSHSTMGSLYLVGKADWDYANQKPTFHAPLKRYSKLSESPIAPVAMMINSYMQGHPRYEKENEFGLPRNDTYYPDIDVATGYSSWRQFWVVIPNEAP